MMNARFEPGDRVLWFRPWGDPVEATVVSSSPASCELEIPPDDPDDEPTHEHVFEGTGDLFLLAPPRRTFAEDVYLLLERAIVTSTIELASSLFWIERALASSGQEDDATLLDVLRAGRRVRDSA